MAGAQERTAAAVILLHRLRSCHHGGLSLGPRHSAQIPTHRSAAVALVVGPSPSPLQSMEKWRRALSREFGTSGWEPGAWRPRCQGSCRSLAFNYFSSYSAPGATKLVEWPRKGFSLEGFWTVRLGTPSAGRERTRPRVPPACSGSCCSLPTGETLAPQAPSPTLPAALLSLRVRTGSELHPAAHTPPPPGRESSAGSLPTSALKRALKRAPPERTARPPPPRPGEDRAAPARGGRAALRGEATRRPQTGGVTSAHKHLGL